MIKMKNIKKKENLFELQMELQSKKKEKYSKLKIKL